MKERIDFPVILQWLDLEKREKFKPTVEIDESGQGLTLREVVADYYLNPKISCGISSCKTLHNKGLLVTLSDGSETNIGHCCGKKNFGQDYTILKNKLSRLRTERSNYDAIVAFIETIPELTGKYNALFEDVNYLIGFKKVHLALIDFSESVRRKMPPSFGQNIGYNGLVTESVRKTDEEIDLEKEANPSKSPNPYKQIKVATVAGYDLTYQLERFYQLKKYFDGLFDFFANRSINQLTKNHIAFYCKEIRSFDENLREVDRLCSKGNILLQDRNFALIKLAVQSGRSNELAKVDSFIQKHCLRA